MSILHRLRVEQGLDPKPKDDPQPEAKPEPRRKGTRTFTTNRKGAGRPPSGSPSYTRNKRVTLPLSLPEYEALHAAASSHGLPLSVVVRKALFGEVKLTRPHPEHPKSEVAVERLSGVEPKIDGRTREGKAQKARKQRAKRAKREKAQDKG